MYALRLLLLIFSLAINAANASGLNDTGITTCGNVNQNGLPCPVSGFPRQDAEYGPNTFSFTKLDAAGNPLPDTATNQVCVFDDHTGLIWEVKTADGGLRDQSWTYTWYNSDPTTNGGAVGNSSGTTNCKTAGRCDTEKFAADVNAVGLCGFNDWRVPTTDELLSIVHNGRYSPSIDTDYFPNTVINWFWTSSSYAYDSSGAWVVGFDGGYVSSNYRAGSYAVRLVRGGE